MKKCTILIVTEANEKVASGHLFESMVCYEQLQKQNYDVSLMVNSDMPSQFKMKLPKVYCEYKNNIQIENKYLIQYAKKNQISIIVFNLRKIENEFIMQLRRQLLICIICIDEFGHRALDADVIINPMINSNYWKYDSKALKYCGAQYLILSPKLVEFHEKDKQINDSIQTITVSMGGVDILGTTLKIAKWLPDLFPYIHFNLVIGGGFRYKNELSCIVEKKGNVSIYQNIDFLYQLFYQSDLAICAGGNTLHELAAIGTPTIVVPSMPHEIQNGLSFEENGFSICCKIGSEIEKRDLMQNLKYIEETELRKQMSVFGKRISDGKGYERVCKIIEKVKERWEHEKGSIYI